LQLIERHVARECAQKSIARSAYRFSRRALREAIGWGDTQLKLHLARLVDLEYLVAHRGAHGAHEYEVLYDGGGEDGRPFVPGLIDVQALKHAYDSQRSGVTPERSAPGRGAVGPWSGGGREAPLPETARQTGLSGQLTSEVVKTHIQGGNGQDQVVALAAARRA
jgi:hypothetical protein